MKTSVAIVRIVIGLAIFTAITATFFDTATRVTVNPFNFFGYFTLQSNIIAAIVLLTVGFTVLGKRKQSSALVLARGAITTYMIIVGIVYAILLAPLGAAGGVPLPWANVILHVIVPIYVAVDWLLIADRPRLSFRSFWVVLIFPVVWVAVVLFRGATDGWFPYPFLDPTLGYGTIAVYCVGIAIAVVVVGGVVWFASRVRLLRS